MLACAVEAFAERGYHGTSISDIVARAGVARATFYQYFQDKRSIFAELLERFIEQLLARMLPIDTTVGPEAGLELLDETPRRGAGGKAVAFLHPRAGGGVLIEVCGETD